MQMNHEKCFPSPAQLQQLNGLSTLIDESWLEGFIAKCTQFIPVSSEELECAFTRLCKSSSLSRCLYYLDQQFFEVPEQVMPIIQGVQSYLSTSPEVFEKKLKELYFGFWYLDFKTITCQILQLNQEKSGNFCNDLDRHFGEQSTISSKELHKDALFEYYAYLKGLAFKKPSDDVKSILLSAFVEQAARCSAGLLVLLYQQIMSINEPINLQQFVVHYSSSLVNGVSERFKDEVDVHQKNFIFSYARKLGYPTREEIDDPHVVPAFDDFQDIISQLHQSFSHKYHFFGVLNYILETILEKIVLNCEYRGLLNGPNDKYDSAKVAEMYEYIKKYASVPDEISSEAVKSIFVTESLNLIVYDEDLFIVKGIDYSKLVLSVANRLKTESIFIDDANWLEQMHQYFDESQMLETLPVFENIFHLAYFIKISPSFRYQDEIILILRHFQSIPEHQWLDDVLHLLKILGNEKNHLTVIETLHQHYPFTQDLALPVPFFKNRLQQIYHQKYLFGPVVSCLNLMTPEFFHTLVLEKNYQGYNLLAQLVEDDSSFLVAFLEKMSSLNDGQKHTMMIQLNLMSQNLLRISIQSNPHLVGKLLAWVSLHQASAMLPLLTSVDDHCFNPLAFAVTTNKKIAIDTIFQYLDEHLDPDIDNWGSFFKSFNVLGDNVLQTIVLHQPEYLQKIINLLSRFDSNFQRHVFAHRNQMGANSIMLVMDTFNKQPAIFEEFLAYIGSDINLSCEQLFSAMTASKENLLIKASKNPQEIFEMVRKIFLNLSYFERFKIIYQMNSQDLLTYPKLLDLFSDLQQTDVIRICQKVDKTTGKNLLLQLASLASFEKLKQVLIYQPYLCQLLFNSFNNEKQNVLMICLNQLDCSTDKIDFLFQILTSLDINIQVGALCHQDKNSMTIFSLTFHLDEDRIGFTHYEKILFLHVLDIFNKNQQFSLSILALMFKEYFGSQERFLRFIKITDYLFNYCEGFREELEHMFTFLLMTQAEIHAFVGAPVELLGHTSKAFQKFYKNKLVEVLDFKFERMRTQLGFMIKIYYLRFSLADFGETANCHKWLNYLLQCPPQQCCELINSLIDQDVNILVFALRHFPDLGIAISRHMVSQPGFDALCFKPNSRGMCIYTSLLKAGVLDIVFHKHMVMLSCAQRLPILANIMQHNAQIVAAFKLAFASSEFSIQEKIDFLKFNFFFYSNYQSGAINDNFFEFLLHELVSLPVLSPQDFNSFFLHSEKSELTGLYLLLELSLKSNLTNLNLFFCFLEKHQRIDLLSMEFGLNTLMHALRGIEQENYQLVIDFLKCKFNFPVLLKEICENTDLIVNTLEKALSVDCTRLMGELTANLPAQEVWRFFITPKANKLCALNYLSLREDLQQDFFDFLKAQQLDFDDDLYEALQAHKNFDKYKGVAILKMCSYLSLDKQIKLFEQWPFLAKYSSKYIDLKIIPALMAQVCRFEPPVIELLVKHYSWSALANSSQFNLQNLNAMFSWLATQPIEIRYLLLNQDALFELFKSNCSMTAIDNLICVIRTLPSVLQKNLLDACLVKLQDLTILEQSKQEKLVAFKFELDFRVNSLGQFAFFEQPKDTSASKGPAPS